MWAYKPWLLAPFDICAYLIYNIPSDINNDVYCVYDLMHLCIYYMTIKFFRCHSLSLMVMVMNMLQAQYICSVPLKDGNKWSSTCWDEPQKWPATIITCSIGNSVDCCVVLRCVALLCCVVLCCVALRCVALCYVMLYVISCYVMLWYVMLCYVKERWTSVLSAPETVLHSTWTSWLTRHRKRITHCITKCSVLNKMIGISVMSRKYDCLVTWFCYHLIAKPGNKAAAPSWPDPYATGMSFTYCQRFYLSHMMKYVFPLSNTRVSSIDYFSYYVNAFGSLPP